MVRAIGGTLQSIATGREKTITARDLLKLLQNHTKLDLPVVVIDDENPSQGYRTVRAFSIWFNGCPVIHVGKSSEATGNLLTK
jgi:hypothetical protein